MLPWAFVLKCITVGAGLYMLNMESPGGFKYQLSTCLPKNEGKYKVVLWFKKKSAKTKCASVDVIMKIG